MKKFLRVVIPVVLASVILICTAWYLFIYDRDFTRDMLLNFARFNENQGNHSTAAWFYNVAYSQSGNNDEVAIELAQQYKKSGNYTKAEYTLTNAIADGGGTELYIALCKTYVEQDKLLDAVTMLDSITNTAIKEQLDAMRPAAPTASPDPGFYNQYISVTLSGNGTVYASPKGIYPSTNDEPCTQPIMLGDGENTIYALCIADNGLPSPLAIYGYTVGGVIKQIDFADADIEAAIRQLLGVNSDQVLYTNDLWPIKNFTVPEKAADLSDLKHMSFVETLSISNTKAMDFTFLSSLPNVTELSISNADISQEALSVIAGLPLLKKLTISNCNLAGVAPLSRTTSLIYLDINNNTVRNIDALGKLYNLQELNLQHNAVTDLSALASLTALRKLDVSYNSLTSLSPLSKLSGLTWVDASVNAITELGQIGNLTALSYLSLRSNQLTAVANLADCNSLVDLNIASNSVTDISSLSALTEMMYFDFSYNKVKTLPEFSKSCQLVTINGSNNLITSLKNLGGLKNLNTVNMDYNTAISSVKELANCPRLIEVNVYGTKVKNVSDLTEQSIIVNYKPV